NGSDNTAVGYAALTANGYPSANTAVGSQALRGSMTGAGNTAVGYEALYNNTTGRSNIAIGVNAAALVDGGNSNDIHIGSQGATSDNGTIRIGTPGTQKSFFAAGIASATVTGAPVLLDTATGQLGVASSSRRFKENIQDMGEASRDLMRLRPVTFR